MVGNGEFHNIEIKEDEELFYIVTEIEEECLKNPRYYTLFCGGAKGSDLYWQQKGAQLGIEVKAYSFENHAKKNTARVVLSKEELSQANEYLIRANKTLKRHFPTGRNFVDNLLRRNWYQVKDTESVFAIARILASLRTVEGGTGWAVQMAIDQEKVIYVFDTGSNKWHKFDYKIHKFSPCRTPRLTFKSTGIGTRQLTDSGRRAIEKVFELTFKP